MKKVYMIAIIRPIGIDLNNKDDTLTFEFGGYNFKINEQDVPFDFGGYSVYIYEDAKGKYLEMYTGKSFFNTSDIDFQTFKGEYAILGIKSEDITAQFLSSATHINEFYFSMQVKNGDESSDAILEDIIFVDEHGIEYHMNKNLLDRNINEINK